MWQNITNKISLMKKYIIFSVFIGLQLCANSQAVYDYLKAANDYFTKANYFSAAKYYEKYVGNGKTKMKISGFDPYTASSLKNQQKTITSNQQQAIYNLAECYRLLNFYSKAEPYYLQATTFNNAQFPLATYWYAKTLKVLANYNIADSVFHVFLTTYNNNDLYKTDAQLEIKNIQFIQQQLSKKDLYLYTVNKANKPLNTTGANYAPMWLNKNSLMFTSTRFDNTLPKNKQYTNQLYVANFSDTTLNNIVKVSIEQPTESHQGVSAITPDNKVLYGSRWTITNGKKLSQLYYCLQTANNTFSQPILVDTSINLPGYSTQQPFIMPDGKHILFSSNRPGGAGGFDLWYAPLNVQGIISGAPINLGNIINSAFDEQAPYYHAASTSLIFSSNGYIGMGSFDFYKSKGNFGSFSTPENLGYPLNSNKDDIYFAATGEAKNVLENVVFSSDRSNECCLDLFYLTKKRLLKKITGQVVNCENNLPIIGANVEVNNSNKKLITAVSTDNTGFYTFTASDFEVLNTTASFKGYNTASVSTNSFPDDEQENQTLNVLCLQKIKEIIPPPPPPPKVDTVVVMNNIYFNFNEATILPESFQYIDDKIVTMMNKYATMVVEVSGHTDNVGNNDYNQKLSEQRAISVKNYLVSKGIATDRIETKGFGESKPIEPNQLPNGKDNPEGRKKNRRIEFKVLRYN